MEGNIEEILAPLRLAVKEQVCCRYNSMLMFGADVGCTYLVPRFGWKGSTGSHVRPVHLTSCFRKCQSGKTRLAN